MRAEVQS
uniref:Cysteine protease n=2 Tax=Oryza TaxID=4527 RepID=A0A1Y8Z4H2_9ORYZ